MKNEQPTILVVDDQAGIRRLLTEILTEQGYIVDTAANGREGLERTEAVNPNVILMDMKMPGMDGLETLRELNRRGRKEKVIMMTAYGELDMVEQAKSLGARAYLIKPFDINVLCQMIVETMEAE